uniref:Uncharacterized protein n=1 Tax=Anguilla anguilla TaxID=7936 RepID=A0A0E9XTW0_ANGAN
MQILDIRNPTVTSHNSSVFPINFNRTFHF